MSGNRLPDYLEHMQTAALDACGYVEGLNRKDFLADKRTQQAVIMNILIIGEATTKIMTQYPEFVEKHPEIQWRGMRGMRNRIAHGYFEINLDVVWNTVHLALPELLKLLPPVIEDVSRNE